MHSNERVKILTTGRGAELGTLIQAMTGDKRGRDLPTASQLDSMLAKIYPGESHADLRGYLFAKLKQVAKAYREGAHQFDLRQLGNELIIEVETKLVDADRLLPAVKEEEEVDAGEIAASVLKRASVTEVPSRPVVGDALVQHRKVMGA